MPLTPQDVHNKVFGSTRLRRGYDEGEVDGFLDQVEAELIRLHQELDSLRAQIDDSPHAEESSLPPIGQPPAGPTLEELQQAAETPAAAAPRGGGDGLEQQVARTLVLAQRAADEAVSDAEQEAERLRLAARSEVERLHDEAQAQAERERLEYERNRSEAMEDVEQLRAFEREYRTRLRAYLELQLRELEGSGQVEGRQSAALSGASVAAAGALGTAGAGASMSDSPLGDSGPVPREGSGDSRAQVPYSVSVDDSAASTGISTETTGEDLRHEPRDLHDNL
jgi:DivIVA domain-containing protein